MGKKSVLFELPEDEYEKLDNIRREMRLSWRALVLLAAYVLEDEELRGRVASFVEELRRRTRPPCFRAR